MCSVKQVGDDKTIKQWNMEAPGYGQEEEPINTILGKVGRHLFWHPIRATNTRAQGSVSLLLACHSRDCIGSVIPISLMVCYCVPVLQSVFTGLDHHQTNGVFVTCGQQVDVWDEQRTSPIRSFSWGVDSFSCVRFNPVEVSPVTLNHLFLLPSNRWKPVQLHAVHTSHLVP